MGEHIGSREPRKKQGRGKGAAGHRPQGHKAGASFRKERKPQETTRASERFPEERVRVSGFDGTRQAEPGTATQTNESAAAGRSETATAAATEDTAGQQVVEALFFRPAL